MTAYPISETLNSLWHGLMGLVLMLLALNTPKGPPSAPSAQLAFPFMAEQKADPQKWKRLYPYASLPKNFKIKRKGKEVLHERLPQGSHAGVPQAEQCRAVG